MDWKLRIESLINNSGKWYPPKNNIELIQENKTIEEYSAKKKKTKGTLECSTKKPATSSDSLNLFFYYYRNYLIK